MHFHSAYYQTLAMLSLTIMAVGVAGLLISAVWWVKALRIEKVAEEMKKQRRQRIEDSRPAWIESSYWDTQFMVH